MKIQFQQNEFTASNILEYLTKAYGKQINGRRFSNHNLTNWVRVGKIPNAYGGHRILKVDKYPIARRIRIYTLEGLTRDILNDVDLIAIKPVPKEKKIDGRSLPRKFRTQYYYDILRERSKLSTKVTLQDSILPDNWREIGIKQNQTAKRRLKKTA